MTLTINGIPESITRAQAVALVEALGIDPVDTDRIARHTIVIPILDPPYAKD